jgi:hypothetical protein
VEDEIMTMFPRMVELVAVADKGIASIRHIAIGEPIPSVASRLGDRFQPSPPGDYALLLVRNNSGEPEMMMSDLAYERATSVEVVRRAHGDILIAGLGLGMILHPILRKVSVCRVTVIEKFQDVIDLILPTLPKTDNLAVIAGDIFDWKPEPSSQYDIIWFDIWPDIGPKRVAEMTLLHRRFANYLNRANPNHWMQSWHFHEAKRIRSAARLAGDRIRNF